MRFAILHVFLQRFLNKFSWQPVLPKKSVVIKPTKIWIERMK